MNTLTLKKIKFLLGMFFALISFISCNSYSTQLKTIFINPNDRVLLLEIFNETSETVYPRGRTLELMLYNNSDLEFDYYSPNTPERVGIPFTTERKIGKCSQKDFENLVFYLEQEDLSTSKEIYLPTKRSMDSSIKKLIKFKYENKEKTIIIEENDNHIHLNEKKGVFPSSLIKLLELSERINKELRKEINTDSR